MCFPTKIKYRAICLSFLFRVNTRDIPDHSNCTVHIDEDEYKNLKSTLAFVKQDCETIDASPCVWSEVHSLRELLAGIVDVDLEAHLVKVAWDSRLGMAIRKNKFMQVSRHSVFEA